MTSCGSQIKSFGIFAMAVISAEWQSYCRYSSKHRYSSFSHSGKKVEIIVECDGIIAKFWWMAWTLQNRKIDGWCGTWKLKIYILQSDVEMTI